MATLSRGACLWFVSILAFVHLATTVDAQAMGRRPRKPPSVALPAAHAIDGFALPDSTLAFRNYAQWPGSHLPKKLQLFHCAGMAILVRQVFNWGFFDPSAPRASAASLAAILKKIYKVPTKLLPGSRERIVIPGYANLRELSAEPAVERMIQDLLGDAWTDLLKRNWNWGLLDVFRHSEKTRRLIELNLRASVARDRIALVYLTDYTKTAHAVLLYGYETRENEVLYSIYDPNYAHGARVMTFGLTDAKFHHEDFGTRDPWILHPYQGDVRVP